jgi:hypothetical protein
VVSSAYYCLQCWGIDLPYGLHITGHNPPCGPSAGWWVLTTANAAGSNCLTCLPKQGVREKKFLVTHPMTDQSCLTSAIARRSALTAEPWSSSVSGMYNKYILGVCRYDVPSPVDPHAGRLAGHLLRDVSAQQFVTPGDHQHVIIHNYH